MRTFLIILGILMIHSPSMADELSAAEISVSAEVNKTQITIGEVFECKFLIRHDPDIKITDSISARHLEGFRIKDSNVIPPAREQNQSIEGRLFKLTAYELGAHIIPAIEVRYLDQDHVQKSVFSSSVTVEVMSVAPDKPEGADIRGLKSIKFLESVLGKIVAGSTAGFIFIASAVIAFIWIKRRGQKKSADALLTPAERAIRALHDLENSGLLIDGRSKAFYGGISTAVRKYLEEQFQMPALEFTTREINRAVSSKEWDSSVQKMLIRVLDDCDTVKFTDYVPHQTSAHQIITRAEEVINLTQGMVAPVLDQAEVKAS